MSQPQLTPLPSSATSSRIDELANFEPLYTTESYDKSLFPPAMPQEVWDDLIKTNPHYATQTMSTTNPMTHRLSASGQTSTGNYEADLTRMKEDPANMFKSKLVLDVGRSRLYQRPYADAFDLVPYPTSWRVPDFIKFSGDDNRSTWEHISPCMAQFGEASSNNSLRIRLFSLSLTGTHTAVHRYFHPASLHGCYSRMPAWAQAPCCRRGGGEKRSTVGVQWWGSGGSD